MNGNSWNRIAQFNLTTQTWENPFGTGLNGNRCLILSSIGNKLYLGGDFTTANNITSNRIAVWNITTQNWEYPFGSGLNNICYTYV